MKGHDMIGLKYVFIEPFYIIIIQLDSDRMHIFLNILNFVSYIDITKVLINILIVIYNSRL